MRTCIFWQTLYYHYGLSDFQASLYPNVYSCRWSFYQVVYTTFHAWCPGLGLVCTLACTVPRRFQPSITLRPLLRNWLWITMAEKIMELSVGLHTARKLYTVVILVMRYWLRGLGLPNMVMQCLNLVMQSLNLGIIGSTKYGYLVIQPTHHFSHVTHGQVHSQAKIMVCLLYYDKVIYWALTIAQQVIYCVVTYGYRNWKIDRSIHHYGLWWVSQTTLITSQVIGWISTTPSGVRACHEWVVVAFLDHCKSCNNILRWEYSRRSIKKMFFMNVVEMLC